VDSHFKLLILFALMISVVMATLAKPTPSERVRYMLRTFVFFVLVGIGIAWALYPFSH